MDRRIQLKLTIKLYISWKVSYIWNKVCDFFTGLRLCFFYLSNWVHDTYSEVQFKRPVLFFLDRKIRIFEDIRGVGLEELWIRVKYLAVLWASLSAEFRAYSIYLNMLDWREAVV